ncbi:MAG: hypothetical protein ACR2RB_07810 [Gammaproteobacteria bacterium]
MEVQEERVLTTRHAQVQVTRGPLEAPVSQVYLHELPILKAIHGDSNVSILDEDDALREVDAMSEYIRLEGKYGNKPPNDQPWVEVVFGRFDDHRFSSYLEQVPEVSKRNVARAQGRLLTGMTKSDLVDEALAHGIQAPEMMARGELMTMIREARDGNSISPAT